MVNPGAGRPGTEYLGTGETIVGGRRGRSDAARTVCGFPVALTDSHPAGNPGDTASTDFRVAASDGQSLTCENPQNEFPKSISYRKVGTELHTEISGGGVAVTFLFAPAE